MTDSAAALAAAHGVALAVEPLTWDELGARGWDRRFAAVFCVGNSLTHATGRDGRLAALRGMAGVLRAGGLLVLTSRNWERVRAAGSGLRVADQQTGGVVLDTQMRRRDGVQGGDGFADSGHTFLTFVAVIHVVKGEVNVTARCRFPVFAVEA